MFILAAYDIVNDRRRLKVANELENFGSRVQFSVFECHLTRSQVREMKRRVESLIDPMEDQVRYYRLCRKDLGLVQVEGPGDLTRDSAYLLL